MANKTFQEFINTIKATNIQPSFYYTDYQVVAKHIEDFKEIIDALGIVKSSSEFEEKFRELYLLNNSVIEITPLFTGVRPDKMVVLEKDRCVSKFNSNTVSIDESIKFLRDVGFTERIDAHSPLDLRSYFFGINVGLDSNGRKNRGGKQMERLVGSYIKPVTRNFIEQAKFSHIEGKWGVKFKTPFKKNKTFDFVIKEQNTIYFIETNFFNSSGSKTDINTRFILLDKQLSESTNDHNFKVVFIVITDGRGLKKAMTEIEDVFNAIDHVYNIDDLNNGIIKKIVFSTK